MDLLELFDGDMGVDLGRLELGVAERLLDEADVGAPFEDQRRHHVPEEVTGTLLLDAGGLERLPVTPYASAHYVAAMPRALRLVADRDRDDAHLLALAPTLPVPIWSNDPHLAGLPVESYTTAVLLKILEL